MHHQVPLYERFAKILQNEEFSCFITRSTLVELETLSNNQKVKHADDPENDFFARARQYGLDECEIIESTSIPSLSNDATNKHKQALKQFSDASRDIFHLATDGGNNKHAYFVATQDETLSNAVREMPYVPLFRLGRAVLLLETPSSASRRFTNNTEQSKLSSAGGLMTKEERQIVKSVKKREREKQKELRVEEQKKSEKRAREEYGVSVGLGNPRRKKAKGPNPLSCKKRKTAK